MLGLSPVAPYRPMHSEQEWPLVLARHAEAMKAWERDADIALRFCLAEAGLWFAAILVAGFFLLKDV